MGTADESDKQASGGAWGDDISPERQAELEQRLQAWEQEADHGERKGPFDLTGMSDGERPTLKLSGADVFWLAARALAGTNEEMVVAERKARLRQARDDWQTRLELRLDALYLEDVDLRDAHLEGARLCYAHLEDADLRDAHLERTILVEARLERTALVGAHMEGAELVGAHMEGAGLVGTRLEGANLAGAHLEGANVNDAHLEGANLIAAGLERASFTQAHLEGASLYDAHLEGVGLAGAHLEGARLSGVRLVGARLYDAHLAGANLAGAHLEGANLVQAHLEGIVYEPDDEAAYQHVRQWATEARIDFPRILPPANLYGAFMDTATSLGNVTLGTPGHGPGQGYVQVADVRWGSVNLAVIKDWSAQMVLGDERAAWAWRPPKRGAAQSISVGKKEATRKELADTRRQQEQDWQEKVVEAAQERLDRWRAAVRANRQLATALREQGMNEEADRFAYRAQVCQRRLFRLQRQWGRWSLQTLLALLAGYGFRLWRILAAYAVVLLFFAVLYWALGVHSFRGEPGWRALWDSFLVSLSAIHGRTIFEQLGPWSPAAWVAAIESVVGIVIEGVFVAMLVQRFFGGR